MIILTCSFPWAPDPSPALLRWASLSLGAFPEELGGKGRAGGPRHAPKQQVLQLRGGGGAQLQERVGGFGQGLGMMTGAVVGGLRGSRGQLGDAAISRRGVPAAALSSGGVHIREGVLELSACHVYRSKPALEAFIPAGRGKRGGTDKEAADAVTFASQAKGSWK